MEKEETDMSKEETDMSKEETDMSKEETDLSKEEEEIANAKLPILHYLASAGIDRALMIALRSGYDINKQDEFGDSPLHVAIGYGQLKCANLLIRAGADVNVKRPDGYSILHTAAVRGYEKLTKLLIDEGAVVDAITDDGETPLHCAVSEAKPGCAKLLLNHGACANVPLSNSGTTALHLAVSKSPECIDLLLKANGDIFAFDSHSVCPLEMAMEAGVQCFQKMCSGNIDVKSKDGVLPLHLAAHCFNDECLEMLIGTVRNVNRATNHGETPLHFVAMLEKSFSYKKKRAQMEAAINRNTRKLLTAGGQILKKNNRGLTPLHVSVKYGQSIAAECFLKYGADVNIRGGNKRKAPLHIASEEGNLASIKLLLESGANKDIADGDNNTALMLAARKAHFESVKILLEYNVPLWVNTENEEIVF